MIKFFRKIRQNLLNEGKTSKYFKYAIGEIVLVVIGILIALQLNNWSQDSKNKSMELETLQSLKLDLISSQNQIERKIYSTKESIKYDSIVLLHLKQKLPKIDKDSLNRLITEHFAPSTFDPEEGILNEIINTGKLNIIKNPKIRSFITSWNMNIREIKEMEDALVRHLSNHKEPMFYKSLSYRNISSHLEETSLEWNPDILLDDIQFENIIVKSYAVNRTLVDRQKNFNKLISEIINEINMEIND